MEQHFMFTAWQDRTGNKNHCVAPFSRGRVTSNTARRFLWSIVASTKNKAHLFIEHGTFSYIYTTTDGFRHHTQRKEVGSWLRSCCFCLAIQVHVQKFALKVPYWGKFSHSTMRFWPATVRNTPYFSSFVCFIFQNMLKHISENLPYAENSTLPWCN